MRVDWVEVALIIGGASLLIFIGCSAYVVLNNSSSRNIVLAAGTIVGATFLFIVQLFFELQPSTHTDFITSEFVIDRALLSIGQWRYTQQQVSSLRQWTDLQTSQWLKKNRLFSRICGWFPVPANRQVYDKERFADDPPTGNHMLFS